MKVVFPEDREAQFEAFTRSDRCKGLEILKLTYPAAGQLALSALPLRSLPHSCPNLLAFLIWPRLFQGQKAVVTTVSRAARRKYQYGAVARPAPINCLSMAQRAEEGRQVLPILSYPNEGTILSRANRKGAHRHLSWLNAFQRTEKYSDTRITGFCRRRGGGTSNSRGARKSCSGLSGPENG
jgi:hypothetical protein